MLSAAFQMLEPRRDPTVFTPDPHGNRDRGTGYLVYVWIMVWLSTLTTLLRAVVRGRLTRNLGSDDYFMIACTITNLIGLGFVTRCVLDGEGHHMYYLSAAQRQNFVLVEWMDWMQTFISICFFKISICLFLLRIKDTRKNKIFLYTFIASNVLLTCIVVGLYAGICDPPSAYWVVGYEGRCFTPKQVMGIVIAQGCKFCQYWGTMGSFAHCCIPLHPSRCDCRCSRNITDGHDHR